MRIYINEEVVETIQIDISSFLFAQEKINVSAISFYFLVNPAFWKTENDVASLFTDKNLQWTALIDPLPEKKAKPIANNNRSLQRHSL